MKLEGGKGGRENVEMKKHMSERGGAIVILCLCVCSETTFSPHLLSLDNTFNTVAILL